MLTPEELKRVRYFSGILALTGDDVRALTPEEAEELASLVDKILQQQESHSPERSIIPEPYQTMVRIELRKMPTWKLREAYGELKGGEPTGIELMEKNRAYAVSTVEEVLWERGKLERGAETWIALKLKMVLLPMSPEEGPPLPRGLEMRWPWKKD